MTNPESAYAEGLLVNAKAAQIVIFILPRLHENKKFYFGSARYIRDCIR